MQSALVALTSLALVGCSGVPMHIDAGNRPTPAVSVTSTESERIDFQLMEPSYVAAIEVQGRQLRALVPTDSSGVLPEGSHDLAFRAVDHPRAPNRGYLNRRRPRPTAGQRFDFFGGCPGREISYEPVPENRAASSGIESPKGTAQLNLRRVPQLCTTRPVRGYGVDGSFLEVAGPPPSRWVILLASDHPIDAERVVENLTMMGGGAYVPSQLAQVASLAMRGHDGTWSAAATRR